VEIPKSLADTWKSVSSDGTINSADFEKLKQAAAPNKLDSEFSESELKFLQNLKSELEQKGGTKGTIPADSIRFAGSGEVSVSLANLKIPESLKSTWERVATDGKLSKDDYRELVHAASPNFADSELSTEEQAFLKKFKDNFSANDVEEIKLVTPEVKNQEQIKSTEKPKNEVPVKNSSLSKNFQNKIDSDFSELNQVKTLLDLVSDDPDMAKLKTIVEQKLGNFPDLNKYSYNVNAILKNTEIDNVKSLQIAKAELEQEFKKLPESQRNDKQFKQVNSEAIQAVETALKELNKNIVQVPQKITPKNSEQPKKENTSNNDGVPETLRESWNSAISDGVLDVEDLEKLLFAAAPNKKNEEFSEQEHSFIKEVRDVIQQNGGSVEVKKPDSGKVKVNESTNSFVAPAIPETVKSVWSKVTADGIINQADFEELLLAASPNKKNNEFDDQELELIASIRDALEKNNGEISLAKSAEKNNNTSTNSNPVSSELGIVPKSMENEWNKIKNKGKVEKTDFESLLKAASPNQKDEELDDAEFNFLDKLKAKLDNSADGVYKLTPVSNNSAKNAPILLNWPGYNKQTKEALANAYSGVTVGSKMPLLPPRVANEVAKSFGVNSIQEMQNLVGAKVDGKFGPETFFRAKAFLANELNRTSSPQDLLVIGRMLEALGKDQEVLKMKEKIANYSQ